MTALRQISRQWEYLIHTPSRKDHRRILVPGNPGHGSLATTLSGPIFMLAESKGARVSRPLTFTAG